MHRGGKRTAAWLLSSVALACLVPSAVAQSFLPGGLGITDPKAHSKVEWTAIDDRDGALCGGAFEEADRSGALQLDVCPALQASRGVKFGYRGLETAFGVIDLRGGMAQMATTDAVTVDRMVQNASQFAQKNTALTIGLTDRLFGDRLTIGMDLAWSQDASVVRSLDRHFSNQGFAQERTGAARSYRVEAKLFDTPEFRWSATGEYDVVDDGYFANQGGRPIAAVLMPGERWKMATSFKAFDVGITGAAERYDGMYGRRESNRLKVAVDGLAVTLTSKSTMARSSVNPAFSVTKASQGVAFEFTPAILLPEPMTEMGDVALFIPELALITLAKGHSVDMLSAVQPAERIEALLNWSGTLGDTTVLYSRESKEDGAAQQSGNINQLLDVSHSVRWSRWRIGAGGTLTDYVSVARSGFDNATLSGSFDIAYEVAGGPKFKLRVGHDRDRFAVGDDSFLSTARTSDIAISADLSTYVCRELDRRDIYLTFEYRRKLDNAVDAMSLSDGYFEEFTTQNDRDGFLLSFGGRL